MFARAEPLPEIAVHMHSIAMTLLAVTGSDLLALLPIQWLEAAFCRDQIVAIPLAETLKAAPVCIVRRSDLPLTSLAERKSFPARSGDRQKVHMAAALFPAIFVEHPALGHDRGDFVDLVYAVHGYPLIERPVHDHDAAIDADLHVAGGQGFDPFGLKSRYFLPDGIFCHCEPS